MTINVNFVNGTCKKYDNVDPVSVDFTANGCLYFLNKTNNVCVYAYEVMIPLASVLSFERIISVEDAKSYCEGQ